MIPELGYFCLVLAFLCAVVQMAFPALSVRAARAQFVLCALSFAALLWCFVTTDLSVVTVVKNSHTLKPLLYKISGVWGNHEGSMLLWVTMLAGYGAALSVWKNPARVLQAQGLIGSGFLVFILLASNPFARVMFPPVDGNDLNPLLQDPVLAIHPPMLYLGYVGFSVAFSFALAALWDGKIAKEWVMLLKPWVLFSWTALTAGIALGSWWAYYELGWGGWWFWDPVENASLMPWLLGTALLHSVIVMEKRGGLTRWTLLLAILTFSLSMLGTFLVRSGVLTSVHAFALDPTRGAFILGLLGLYTGGALFLYAMRAAQMGNDVLFAPVSREGALVLNNLFLTTATATVLTGTLYPLLMQAMGSDSISVGPPYFNATILPLLAPMVVLMGVGPFLAWKTADFRAVMQRLQMAAIFTIIIVLFVLAMKMPHPGIAVGGMGLAAWLITATLSEWAGHARMKKKLSWARIRGMKAAQWSLSVAHIGLGVAIIGMVGTALWTHEDIAVMKVSDKMTLGRYELNLIEVVPAFGANYNAMQAHIEVRDGSKKFVLRPERRLYPAASGRSTTEAGIRTSWHDDVYVALGNYDEKEDAWVVHAWVHPLVPFLWIGFVLMALGGFIGLWEKRRA